MFGFPSICKAAAEINNAIGDGRTLSPDDVVRHNWVEGNPTILHDPAGRTSAFVI